MTTINRTKVPPKKGVGRKSNERLMIELLDEMNRRLKVLEDRLLALESVFRSPVCRSCGALGAKKGNPPMCANCRDSM